MCYKIERISLLLIYTVDSNLELDVRLGDN